MAQATKSPELCAIAAERFVSGLWYGVTDPVLLAGLPVATLAHSQKTTCSCAIQPSRPPPLAVASQRYQNPDTIPPLKKDQRHDACGLD